MLTRWDPRWQAYGLVVGRSPGTGASRESLSGAVAEALGLSEGVHFRLGDGPIASLRWGAGTGLASTVHVYRVELAGPDVEGVMSGDAENC